VFGDSAPSPGRLFAPVSLPPMSVDFAAEGLLDGLEGEAREARERLLRRLHDDGVSLDELRQAVEEQRLILLPAERLIGGEARYTGREVAERTGLEPDFLMALRRAHSLPVPDPDAVAFTEADLEAAWTARTFQKAGVRPEDMLAITRVLGRGLTQAAELMRSVTLELVLKPGTPEDELALRYADAAAQLEPLTAPMLGQMINLHLRHIVRTHAGMNRSRRSLVSSSARRPPSTRSTVKVGTCQVPFVFSFA